MRMARKLILRGTLVATPLLSTTIVNHAHRQFAVNRQFLAFRCHPTVISSGSNRGIRAEPLLDGI